MKAFLRKLEGGGKVVVVALGDSITELTWHTRGHLNWCGYLQEALFETYGRGRCRVINAGYCGDSAPGCLARLDEDALRFRPDLVIVSFGMNDAAGTVRVDAFRDALRSIIERCRSRGADVLLRTPNPIVNPPTERVLKEGQTPSLEAAGTRVAEFAAVILEVAQEAKCEVVDHYASWKKLEELWGKLREEPNHLWLYMSDPVHPGPLGHLAFFREMAALFRVPAHFPWEARQDATWGIRAS